MKNVLILIVCALTALPVRASGPDNCSYLGPYRNAFDYESGGDTRTLDSGDLDNDGRPDIVVANRGSDTVRVFRNRGLFDFAESVEYDVGNSPTGVEVVDVNGDGFLDIVVANSFSSFASILINDQTGFFEPEIQIPVARDVEDITTGDLDADGIMDLVGITEAGVAVMFGLGDASYAPAQLYDGFSYLGAVEIGDLNHDGILDIVFSNSAVQTPRFYVLMGIGDGVFGEAVEYATGSRTRQLLLEDVNRDGNLDVLTSSSDSGRIILRHGRGDGTFESGFPVDYESQVAMTFGDFTGDGIPDLLSTGHGFGSSHSTLRLMRGELDGTLAEAEVLSGGGLAIAMIADDFDNDGHLDVAIVANTLMVIPGDGEGGFHTRHMIRTQHPLSRFVVGDFNEDGIKDVIATSDERDLFAYFNGIGMGDQGSTEFFSSLENPYAIGTGDMNLDGHADLVVGYLGMNLLRIHLSNGEVPFATSLDLDLPSSMSDVLVEDIDQDGDLDIVCVHAASDSISVILNERASAFSAPMGIAVGDAPQGVRLKDLNQDGLLDLIVHNSRSDNFSVALASSLGEFSSPMTMLESENPQAFDIADMNGDAVPDLIVADYVESNGLLIAHGNGDGTFAPYVHHEAPRFPRMVRVIEHDEQSFPEIIVRSLTGSELSFYRTLDGESYMLVNTEQVGANVADLYIGDFNDDQLLDVVVLTSSLSGVVVLYAQEQCEPCQADMSFDGMLNEMDILAFIDHYGFGRAEADINLDGQINFFDVSCYIDMYQKGCGF